MCLEINNLETATDGLNAELVMKGMLLQVTSYKDRICFIRAREIYLYRLLLSFSEIFINSMDGISEGDTNNGHFLFLLFKRPFLIKSSTEINISQRNTIESLDIALAEFLVDTNCLVSPIRQFVIIVSLLRIRLTLITGYGIGTAAMVFIPGLYLITSMGLVYQWSYQETHKIKLLSIDQSRS